MNTIDVSIIATLRPEILHRTLDSFFAVVKYSGKLRAVANIDCIPVYEHGLSDTVEVITDKFKDYTLVTSNQPSFAKAVKTAWKNTTSEYVFHLEDDWEFTREINLDDCITMMSCGGADYVRFSKREKPSMEESRKVALLPSLWRGETVRELSKYMSIQRDPEKQLRVGEGNEYIDKLLPKNIIDYPGGLCVRDIGREWRDGRGLVKWDKNNGKDITWGKHE